MGYIEWTGCGNTGAVVISPQLVLGGRWLWKGVINLKMTKA
jgi:hypothetical protein